MLNGFHLLSFRQDRRTLLSQHIASRSSRCAGRPTKPTKSSKQFSEPLFDHEFAAAVVSRNSSCAHLLAAHFAPTALDATIERKPDPSPRASCSVQQQLFQHFATSPQICRPTVRLLVPKLTRLTHVLMPRITSCPKTLILDCASKIMQTERAFHFVARRCDTYPASDADTGYFAAEGPTTRWHVCVFEKIFRLMFQ